mmetsp:Transcript_14664/g.17852  ORF Transcript_14664/g.17852 Transcript_14664/m.17852 type:complete len:584 (+) Transcript_14664:56-1807(+)
MFEDYDQTMNTSSDEEEQSLVSAVPVISYNRLSTASNNISSNPFTVKVNHMTKEKVLIGEHAPAYSVLKKHNLLISSFRKERFADIFEEGDLDPNTSLPQNFVKRWKWGVYWTPGCGFLVYKLFNKEVVVPPGYVCPFTDEDNNYIFAKPGLHNIQDPFIKKVSNPIPIHGSEYQRNVIEHGNRIIVTVPQGMLGYVLDMGQPILLPPGLHSWKSDTIRFDKMYRLDDRPVLQMGPYTILTVDDGYIAITMNNGKQILLEGGKTHLLTHHKWRFERFMNMKLQSDDLRHVTASSADNLLIEIDAVVTWRISTPQNAAIMITETILRSDISIGTATEDEIGSLGKLRRHVLKQAASGLAKFIGSVNYSDYFRFLRSLLQKNNSQYSEQEEERGEEAIDNGEDKEMSNPFFDGQGIESAVESANKITNQFGVDIISMNVISVTPADPNLTASLAMSAVSSAEALHAETQAMGMARSTKIEAEASAVARKITAESEANAVLIQAKAEAEADILRADGAKAAEILRAEGAKQTSSLLETSKFAVTLETIKASSLAIKDTDKFFFGQDPNYLSNLVLKTDQERVISKK